MASTTTVTWTHLAPNPQSAYKQLFVKGTRIRARVLYGLFTNADEPMTPEEIAADYGVAVDAVLEAITYCKSSPPEIAEDLSREERIMEATGMNDPEYKYGGKYKIVPPDELARILES